jgi:EAL domain-containing protein (putative c-di-GMP-specific phosphodiesterase class I)
MKDLGCNLQQGYYFTPALPPDEFEAWVSARR